MCEGGSWTGGVVLPAEQEGISVRLLSSTANDSAETPGKACDYARAFKLQRILLSYSHHPGGEGLPMGSI